MRFPAVIALVLGLLTARYSLPLSGQTVAGFRASRLLENYPGGQFPSVNYWPAAADHFSRKFSSAIPGGIWIVSLYQGAGVTELQFPGSGRPQILFSAADSSEAYLTMLDSAGAKIWLQVEPGGANIDTLIDLVLDRYEHHPCVAGFGVDVEWFQANTHLNGKQVSDGEALAWEMRVKAHNPRYTLFLKHWLPGKMPPSHRGDILFVDDSQGFASLAAMTAEFKEWSAAFPANSVGFQFGYPADSLWWKKYPDPMKSIGDTLRTVVPNTAGLYWVDFTLHEVFPVPPTYYVSPSGSDLFPGTEAQPWKTIQHAANNATPGSSVLVKSGIYNEKIVINVSGTPSGGPIIFQRFANDSVIVDGTGIAGDQIILIENKSYIIVNGLELRNNLDQSFGTGIWVRGSGDHISLRNNAIHNMRAASGGGDAMGISVYGTHPTLPLSNIVIDQNHLYDCEPGHSEALTINGNVDTFLVTNNLIHDVDNIGIDMIGGEGTSPSPATDAARNGRCSGNVVFNARSNYGGGYAAGIYVDGGMRIIVERNRVSRCDVGMEIGCENAGRSATGIIVRNNILFNNDKAGLGFGGYDFPSTGSVTASLFEHNTLFQNDALGTGNGEVWIQHAQNCTVRNNIMFATAGNRLMTTTIGSGSGNVLDYNLWYAPGGNAASTIDWNGTVYGSYAAYRDGTGQDSRSIYADPLFVSLLMPDPDLHLQSSSPAIDRGDPLFIPALSETDIDGNPRVVGARVDIGATEKIIHVPGPPAPPEIVSALPGNGSVTLRWRRNAETDFWKYRMYGGISPVSAFLIDSTAAITETIKTIIGLVNNVEYFFRITAADLDGEESAFSNEYSAIPVSGSAPPAPQLVGVTREAQAFRFRWRGAPDATAYHLQSSPEPGFATVALDTSSGADTSMLASTLAESTVYYWRVRAVNTLGAGAWSDIWSLLTTDGNITVECLHRWNLLSLPAEISDPRADVLFPTAASPAFGYRQGYAIAETLAHGEGYWMKFAGTQPVRFTGAELSIDTVEVREGWNLIGSLSVPIAVNSISSAGAAVVSSIFSYAGGYAMADSLKPGRGYWVKVRSDGRIILTANALAPEKTASPAGGPEEWSALTLHDADGNSQTLSVAPSAAQIGEAQWALPPPPPQGIFDVRFGSDRAVESPDQTGTSTVFVVLRSAAFPVKIEWKQHNSDVQAFLGDSEEALSDRSEIVVARPVSSLRLKLRTGCVGPLPREYSLSQNYPNPFNGGTRVEFFLPVDSQVRLAVYDILGRRVAQLADELVAAGRHARTWDARGAASGVYFCRLTAGTTVLARTMLVMK